MKPDWRGWPVLARCCCAPDHPALAGHFPGHPVLPGALLLDWACSALAGAQPLYLREVRFLRPCGPGSRLALRACTGAGASRFAITLAGEGGETLAVSGTLAALPADADGPTP
jgi:3-hydroxymyristoyl/3-hydroxydecanoyl-(acyl carrier protein) dehydratase